MRRLAPIVTAVIAGEAYTPDVAARVVAEARASLVAQAQAAASDWGLPEVADVGEPDVVIAVVANGTGRGLVGAFQSLDELLRS